MSSQRGDYTNLKPILMRIRKYDFCLVGCLYFIYFVLNKQNNICNVYVVFNLSLSFYDKGLSKVLGKSVNKSIIDLSNIRSWGIVELWFVCVLLICGYTPVSR